MGCAVDDLALPASYQHNLTAPEVFHLAVST